MRMSKYNYIRPEERNNMIEADPRLSNEAIFKSIADLRIFGNRNGQLYKYCNGRWIRMPKSNEAAEIRRIFTKETQGALSGARIDAIARLLKEVPAIALKKIELNTGKIQFQNGVLDTRKNCFQKGVTGGEELLAYVEANYIPKSTIESAPTFKRYCESSLQISENPDKLKLLLQIIGYCISDFTVAKKAFFFIGAPSSGKSVLLSFLKSIIPEEEISQIPFGDLSGRFNIGQLRNARINLCPELSESAFPNIDKYKAIVSADLLMGEEKGKEPYYFSPYCKLLSAGNVVPIPKRSDGTASIVERMQVLFFAHTIPREDQDRGLFDKLKEDRDTIISLAADALIELVAGKFRFCDPDDTKQFMNYYMESMNSVDVFITSELEENRMRMVETGVVWERYKEFCEDNALPVTVSLQIFVQHISSLPYVSKCRTRIEGKQKTVFKGISFRSDDKSKLQEKEIEAPLRDERKRKQKYCVQRS